MHRCVSHRLPFSAAAAAAAATAAVNAEAEAEADADLPPMVAALQSVTLGIGDRYFFPGHCGGRHAPASLTALYGQGGLFVYDLPELDGLDNVHCPEGPLLSALQLAAQLYGAKRSWFLVNGSTSGVLSALLACARLHHQRHGGGGTGRGVLVMGRDSHKSAFDGVALAGCDAVLLPCVCDAVFGVPLGVEMASVRAALDAHGADVCGVLLTRPSYQGVLSSAAALREVAQLCRARGVPLVVDEAHGSHLRFLGRPEVVDALGCGADVVVQSTHKTLTALSQAAMMHLGSDAFGYLSADERDGAAEVLHECFSALTTTSPNAALLASLDATRAQMASPQGRAMVQAAAAAADDIRAALRREPTGSVMLLDDAASLRPPGHAWVVDPLRLTVAHRGRSALAVDDKMCEERGIYCELNLRGCISYGVPPGATTASVAVLKDALLTEHKVGAGTSSNRDAAAVAGVSMPRAAEIALVDMGSLRRGRGVAVPVADAIGRISAETICPYPPGIPLVVRGEHVTSAHVAELQALAQYMGRKSGDDNNGDGDDDGVDALGSGCTIVGASDKTLCTIKVVT